LTRPAMRKLAPGRRLHQHGIAYEKLPNGDGRFLVNVMVDGQRVHRVVGLESAGVTREKAEQLIEQFRTEARHERLNLPKGRKLALGFKDAANRYLGKLVEEGGRDMKMKRSHLDRHLVPFFQETPLDKLSSFDVERFKKAQATAGASAGSTNRRLAVLSHLYAKAIEWKWIAHRPFRIKRLREGNGRIVYLTQGQIARLLEAARLSGSAQLYLFVLIGLETSMRLSEILSIRVENIDPDRKTIFVPKAKAGARSQPMTSHLARVLRGHIETLQPGQVWLFPSKSSASGHTQEIKKSFRSAVLAAGLDPREVIRHTLRHTAISHAVQAGVDLPTVQRVSGHKTLSMVARYAHQNGAHIEAAMDKLEARIAAATVESVPHNYTGITQTKQKRPARNRRKSLIS